jgi:hypothetical protein
MISRTEWWREDALMASEQTDVPNLLWNQSERRLLRHYPSGLSA